MTVNGAPIDQYTYLPGPVTVQYKLAFEEQEARVSEGLTISEYEALPGTPRWVLPDGPEWTKCHVLMRYRMSRAIPAVGQDAQAREMKRRADMNRTRPRRGR